MMNLQTWAEWVHEIDALTGGGRVELRAEPGDGMTISVRWEREARPFKYSHGLSLQKMKSMYDGVQPCVLESITNAVRKATPNVKLTDASASG